MSSFSLFAYLNTSNLNLYLAIAHKRKDRRKCRSFARSVINHSNNKQWITNDRPNLLSPSLTTNNP